MKNDIIGEVLKNTAIEMKNQVLETPWVVIPFAVCGLIQGLMASALVIVLMFVYIAYNEYKFILEDIESGAEEVITATSEPVVVEPTDTEVK